MKEWARGSHLYERMVKRTEENRKCGGEIKAVLWYQVIGFLITMANSSFNLEHPLGGTSSSSSRSSASNFSLVPIMANRDKTSSPEIHCVFVETSLDTRLVLPVHQDEIISNFKDKLRKEHKQVFPEIGDINVSALKVKRRRKFYHLSESMNVCTAFDGISGNWFMYADAVRVEKGEVLTVMAADDKHSNLELFEKKKELAIGSVFLDGHTKDLILEEGLETQVVEKKTKKRKIANSDGKKTSRKKSKVDLNQSAAAATATTTDTTASTEIVNEINGLPGNVDRVDATFESYPISGRGNLAKETEMGEKSVEDLGRDFFYSFFCHAGRDNIETDDLASHPENQLEVNSGLTARPVTEKKKKQKKSKTVEVCDPVGVSKVEVKTQKSKMKNNSFDHKTDDMEENVSLPRKDEEPEFDREKLETSLSSSVLIHNNMAQGVASSETGGVPRCSCEGLRTRKLVVFDFNGILADVVQGFTGEFVPDGKVSYRSVFRRPFVSSFLDFCFERFHVAIWSSRRIGFNYMVNIVMKNSARNLLFCFDQSKCTTTKFVTQEKNDKPLFLKDLRTVWDRFGTCLSCGKRKYDETNTLLVDDSPNKALCNPPHTGIFPCSYQYTDRQDSALGPDGELRKYLERLADAENVQKFVADNPFGQTAITETHESWEFYSKVIEAHK